MAFFDLWKRGRSVDRDPNVPSFEHRDPVWDKHWKEQCQHSAWMLHTDLYKIEGHYEDVHRATRRSTPVRDETRHTDTRQEIHRRRWRISPSAGIHFSDAAGIEQLFEKKTNNVLGVQTPNGAVESKTEADVFIQELGTSFSFQNWWMTHRRFYLQKDWSTRRDIHTRGNLCRVRF